MKPLPHLYTVEVSGGPTGYADLESPGLATLRVAAPVEYDGPGDAWSPEQLLVAAVASCFLLTFRALAAMSRLPFLHLAVAASGTVGKQEGGVRFTGIVLRPQLTLRSDADREQALRLLNRSEKVCLVTASLSTPVRLEPTIVEADAVAPAARR